jgi:hypothetical protein
MAGSISALLITDRHADREPHSRHCSSSVSLCVMLALRALRALTSEHRCDLLLHQLILLNAKLLLCDNPELFLSPPFQILPICP